MQTLPKLQSYANQRTQQNVQRGTRRRKANLVNSSAIRNIAFPNSDSNARASQSIFLDGTSRDAKRAFFSWPKPKRCGDWACRFRWLLPWRENRIRTHIQTASGFGSLAAEFDLARGSPLSAAARVVDFVARCFSSTLARSIAKQRSTPDGSLLVHQQFL